MDFGPDNYYKCPSCKKMVSQGTFSQNNFGSTLYSDGCESGVSLVDSPEVTKCKNCKTIFWLNAKSFAGQGEMYIKEPQFKDAVPASLLTFNEIKKAIKDDLFSNEKEEKHLRNCLWLCFNDRIRTGKSGLFTNKTDEKLYMQNCLRLIELFNKNYIEEMFLTAELCRNIKDFTGCKTLLNAIPVIFRDEDNNFYKVMSKLILRECKKKNPFVIMIKDRGRLLG